MVSLSDKQIIEYFHRSFKAVDGLWFLKMEEKFGFDNALKVDREVWKVMPRIQARMIKSMLETGKGATALLRSLMEKLSLEGFKFKVERSDKGFKIKISGCPWHDLMVKSGREGLSGKVGADICSVEYSVWATEFDENVRFTLEAQKCEGPECCVLNFRTS